MVSTVDTRAVEAIRTDHYPIGAAPANYAPIMDLIGNARIVAIGEASHGTHEFYLHRAEITKQLIQEKGVTIVAVEADWPDAYRVNAYVQGRSDDEDANQALSGFLRFPTWMWRNTVVLDFVEWMREYNSTLPPNRPKAGFYGIDLYSLYTSVQEVIEYLERIDPDAAERARTRYSCFEHFAEDITSYGYAVVYGIQEPCEDDVVEQLLELQARASELAMRDGRVAEDDYFYATQNARLVANAEAYYRTMFRGRESSWNLRDEHMADTLDALLEYHEARNPQTKAAIWAHNSHLGDARATEMGQRGEWNVGQLMRERHPGQCTLIGFTTHHGTVTAAKNWDWPAERMNVRPALPQSYEQLFHQTGIDNFFLNLQDSRQASRELMQPRLERAIGVIYRPETERASHYFRARLARQFDGVIHLDETQALEPLERTPLWIAGEPPLTFPFAV